jgi:hypothetical protein
VPEKMTIYCKYEGYGYVARSPESDKWTRKCSGPREAADELATSVFGKGNYTLARSHYKIYTATKTVSELIHDSFNRS